MAKTIIGKFPLKGASLGESTPTFETEGYIGESCRAATDSFEKAIGQTVDEQVKDEMYETEERSEFLREGE